MNERIKELIDQATEEIANPFDPWQYDKFFNQEKFAELIIHKCASIVYQTCQDGDIGAQAILYEFDIDNTRSQK